MGQSRDWSQVLRPAVGLVAAATIAAGAYLLDPAAVDLGFVLDVQRTWLAGAFLITIGSALAFKVLLPKGIDSGSIAIDLLASVTLGSLSHYVYGLIACAIGAQALFLDPANYWAALLLVPGLLCLIVSFDDDTDDESADADSEIEDQDGLETGEKPEFGQAVRTGLAMGGFFGAFAVALMAWLGVAVWVYTQLRRIVIDGEAPASLAGVIEKGFEFAPRLALIGIGLALFLSAMMFLISLIPWPSARAKTTVVPGLGPAEARYVSASSEALRAYAKARGLERNRWLVEAFAFVSLMGMIGLGALAMIGGGQWLEASAMRPALPLEIMPFGWSWIVGFFAFIFGGMLPNAILSRLSPRYAELAGWAAVSPKKNPEALADRLRAALQSRRLSAAAPIDPGAFLRTTRDPAERWFLTAAAATAAVALLLLSRDLNSSAMLGDDAIETTEYWTGSTTRYLYRDVAKVELRCFLTDKNEPVAAYVLHFKDGHELDIYTKPYLIEAQIAAYEAIDAKLVALNAPFVPGSHQGLLKRSERGYDAECVEALAGESSQALRPRVKRLFHSEAMAAVADIWPWDDTLGLAKRAGDAYEVEKAVAFYSQAIASGRLPANLLAFAYFGRADARYDYVTAYGLRDGEVILALRDYQKSREIEPTERVYGREGSAYIALGAYDDAKAAYRKALERDRPKPHWSLIGLARVERVQGNYDAALSHLDELLQQRGEDGGTMPIHFHRAWVLYLKGDNAGATGEITKGLVYQTNYSGAYQLRACSSARAGDLASAKADIALALRLLRDEPVSAWTKTPFAKALFADYERDRATIEAIDAGTADEASKVALCADSWNYGERLRLRSPLLPAGG